MSMNENISHIELIKDLATLLGCEPQYHVIELDQVGGTGYIDSIPLRWLEGKKLLYGKDYKGREYIAFILNVDWGNDEKELAVVSAFRRYTDDTTWVCSLLGLSADNFPEMVEQIKKRLSPDAIYDPFNGIFTIQ